MKKIYLIGLFCLIYFVSFSQEVRLNTYAGYVFDDRVSSYYSSSSYYEGTIKGGFQWGAGLEYKLPNGKGIELQYLRQDTQAPMVYQDGGILGGQIQRTTFDLANNYILVNGNNYFQVNDKVEPYFGAGIGMIISNATNPDNGRNQNSTKFAWGIRGGSNFWLADNVGIKIQASLMSAVQGAGGGIYFGTGGVGTGISTYSTIYQFGFQGGLVFRFSQN